MPQHKLPQHCIASQGSELFQYRTNELLGVFLVYLENGPTQDFKENRGPTQYCLSDKKLLDMHIPIVASTVLTIP